MSKGFLAVLALTVAALIGVFVVFGKDDALAPSQPNANPTEVTATDHVKGAEDAPVTLIEYGDFQCPACKSVVPAVNQLSQEMGEQVRIVFRHFPLTSIHPNAFAAARAAQAAGGQGKFFEMHDLLYEKQAEWGSSSQAQQLFRDYALSLGLDINQFNDTYNSSATTEAINADVASGQQLGAQGTPTFFINGELVEQNPRTYQELKALVEAKL